MYIGVKLFFSSYSRYSDPIDYLKLTMNTKQDPCEDFYDYSCGKYPTGHANPEAE